MTRDEFVNAIDSPTVEALSDVFMHRGRIGKSYGELVVDVLWPSIQRSSADSVQPAMSEGQYWTNQLNACWDRSMSDALKTAAKKALNYIENTEGELGMTLSCGDALRSALAACTEPQSASIEALADGVVREMHSVLKTQWDRDCLRAKTLTALRAARCQAENVGPAALVEQRINALEVAHDKSTDHKTRDALRAAITSLSVPHEQPQAESATAGKEPDAWEWRYHFNGRPGAWIGLDQPIERFREKEAFNLENGTYELRPLYAGEPLALSRPQCEGK